MGLSSRRQDELLRHALRLGCRHWLHSGSRRCSGCYTLDLCLLHVPRGRRWTGSQDQIQDEGLDLDRRPHRNYSLHRRSHRCKLNSVVATHSNRHRLRSNAEPETAACSKSFSTPSTSQNFLLIKRSVCARTPIIPLPLPPPSTNITMMSLQPTSQRRGITIGNPDMVGGELPDDINGTRFYISGVGFRTCTIPVLHCSLSA